MPAVLLRNRDELRPRPGAVHAYALSVWAKMTPPGQAIATMSTGNVPLAHDQIALAKTLDVIAHAIYNAHKLVADGHRHRNRFLRPGVPVVDVQVRATNRCLQDADEHVIAADFWNRNLLEPETRVRFCFDNRFHRPLHDRKVCKSAEGGKIFASAGGWSERSRVTKTIISLAVSVIRIALTRQPRVS